MFPCHNSKRSQVVVLEDSCSSPLPLKYGVSQASILSPMLFCIYMKLLSEVSRGLGLCCAQYVDDMLLYLQVPSAPWVAVEQLGHGLERVKDWMRANKLKLNPNKNEVLVVAPDLAVGVN